MDVMTFGGWLADKLSGALDPVEREAVLGDLAESETGPSRAVRELTGLIVRRQAMAWQGRQPWLGLTALAIPLGFVLSLVSRWWADGSAIYLWLYFDNWTWGYLDSPGARRDFLAFIANLGLSYLTLSAWSWTTGFVLGSLSRRAVWINAALFTLVLFAGTVGTVTAAAAHGNNAAVFSDALYRVAYPILMRVVLIVCPAFLGIRESRRRQGFGLFGGVACAMVVAVLTTLTAGSLSGSLTFGWLSHSSGAPIVPRSGWLLKLLPAAMAWPAAFILVNTTWRRRGPCVP
jgi:hypothetical protein